jgi:uncharacterized protein YggE
MLPTPTAVPSPSPRPHVKLGEVQTVSETSTTPVQFASSARPRSSGTPVEPGSVQVEEDVTVTFRIR